MLKCIQIKNFRILNQLNLPDLSRINLITGRNGCGKTTVLEAVFLLSGAGNAKLLMLPDLMRGLIPNIDIRERSENPWQELFSNLETLQAIEIVGNHDEFGELKLEIALEKPLFEKILINQKEGNSNPSNLETSKQSKNHVTNMSMVPALGLRYFRNSSTQAESKIQPSAKGFDISQSIAYPPFIASYISPNAGSYENDVRRFGQLRRKKMEDILLRGLKVIKPELQSVEESSATGASIIYGDVGLHELVPLSVMGGGISWIARLILAISSAPGGVVVVDKVERDLHHTLLSNFWKVIDEATSTFKVQLILTTQSLENIEAACSVLDREHLRLHRVESKGKKNRCVTYTPESIRVAMKHGLEVR